MSIKFDDAPAEVTPSPAAAPAVAKDNVTPPAQQSESLGWRAQFPTEFHESLKAFEKPGDFAKTWKESQDKLGKAVVIPDTEDADLSEVYTKLGRPEKPEDYVFEKDPTLKIDEASEKAWREAALKAGLTKKQAASLFAFEQSVALESRKQREEARKSQAENLKTLEATNAKRLADSWGINTEARKASVDRYLESAPVLAKKLEQTGLRKDPDILNLIWGQLEKTSDPMVSGSTPKTGANPYAERYPKTKF